MKRAVIAIILVLGVGATALYAADFWVSKQYTDWSNKEVEKMVNNSPWAQSIRIAMAGGGSGRASSMNVYVRWVSAMPVRQAIARLRYGGKGDSAEAVEDLQRKENNYIVSVAPLDIDFVRAQYKELKSNTNLEIDGKAPIAPSEVSVRLREDGAAAYFFFPREQNGQASISESDKEVQFFLNLGPMQIKRKFKLKDMVSGDGLAL